MDFHLGSWLVQPELNALVRGRETRHVTPKSMDLLVCLARREGRVASKDEIHKELWPSTFVTDDALTRCIVELRRALQESARDPEIIGTVSRRGYRVLVPVVWDGALSRAPAVSAEATAVAAGAPAAAASPVAEPAVTAPPTVAPGSWPRRTARAGLGLLAVTALLSGTWVVLHRSRARVEAPVVRAVAVLPLADLSGDPDQEYFADGMTDELITELAHIEAWKVISRTSSMRYRRSTAALPEIAHELGVDAVVEGTVLRSGDRVRITVQLIRASTDGHLWSGSFERETRDGVRLQREVAQAIASDFRLRFNPRQARTGDPPAEPAAYEAYLRGWYFFNRSEFAKAASYFEEATLKEPTFALAHALLYEADATDTFLRDLPFSPRALRAMERARALDDTLAEVHDAAGDVAFFGWNWAAGEAEYRRAVELDPRSVDAALHYALCLHALTRWDEAIREYRRALELDPVSLRLNGELVWLLMNAHRYPEALAQQQRTIELDPNQSGVYFTAGTLYEAMGKDAEAAAAYLDSDRRSNPDKVATLREAIAARGLPGYWQAICDRLREEGAKRGAKPTLWYAKVCVRAGRRSEALGILEAAFAQHNPHLAWIKADAGWDPVRSDPRFQAVLQRMSFPD